MEDSNTTQINLRLTPSLSAKVKKDKKRFGFTNKTALATDVFRTFYSSWVALQERKLAVEAEEIKRAI